jgi:hypothetical protein
MISTALRTTFHLLETAAFLEWRDATPERKEEITRELGHLEARAIIREIEEQSKSV